MNSIIMKDIFSDCRNGMTFSPFFDQVCERLRSKKCHITWFEEGWSCCLNFPAYIEANWALRRLSSLAKEIYIVKNEKQWRNVIELEQCFKNLAV